MNNSSVVRLSPLYHFGSGIFLFGYTRETRFDFLADYSTSTSVSLKVVIMRWNILGTANAEAGPSTSRVGTETKQTVVPTVNRYEGMLKDEEKYQAAQYQTTEEVPGCMTLL
jgi:hypothetical protein